MAGKLSFSIAINLLTDNFKRGTHSVRNGFRAMQMQVLTFAAALGAGGLGLTDFISRLVDVARETGRMSTALKNVSGSTAQYVENQRFLLEMAKKYGLEINALTGNFAKFTASASAAGMGMEDQKKIFESVSRATTAFGMSADDSNSVFLALSQMMSKGKISSEELRLQMGEKLPIALQAMAKAAGVSVAELDKLMKQGKLMSADMLPKFAEALDKMIPNVDTDNLETSMNKLKNTFTEFAKGADIEGKYKRVIDAVTGLMAKASANIQGVIANLAAVITGVILSKAFKWIATEVAKAQASAMFAARKAAKVAGESFDAAAWKAQSAGVTIRTAFTRAGAAIRAAFISILPMAVFTAVASLIANYRVLRKEIERINNILPETKKIIESSNKSPVIAEVDKMQQLKGIVEDINSSTKDRKGALTELNGILGSTFKWNEKTLSVQGDINEAVRERIRLLEGAAKVDMLVAQKQKLTERQTKLQNDPVNSMFYQQGMGNYLKGSKVGQYFNLKTDKQLNKEELINTQKAIALLDNDLADAVKSTLTNTTQKAPSGDAPGNSDKKTELQKAEDEYINQIKTLTNQRANGAITEKEYNDTLAKLNESTYKQLAGMLTPEKAKTNSTFQSAKQGLVNTSEADKTMKSYWDSLDTYSNQYAVSAITEKEYREAKLGLIDKTLKEIAGFSDLNEANMSFIADLKAAGNELKKVEHPKLETRDTTFDYKKSKKDIAGEELSQAKKNLDLVKEAYDKGATELVDELNNAMNNVKTLDEALKIAEVKEDIKDLKKQLNEGLYSGVKDIAGSADRMVGAFGNLKDVFNDVDSSGWERIMAVWNAMTSAVDSFMSILNLISTMTEVVDKLAKAKEAEAAIDTATTGVKVINAATEATAEVASAGTSIMADTAACEVKKSTAATNIAASTSEGAAESGKSAAKLPFPWNLVAIGAAIAASIAAFALIPKFANGGILTGSRTGDNNVARFNGGEMFLNGRQQATLFQIANGKGINSNMSISGSLRAAGTDLIAVIEATNRKARRGR